MENGGSSFRKALRRIFRREEYLEEKAGLVSGIRVVNRSVKFSEDQKIKHALLNAVLLFSMVTGVTMAFADSFEIGYSLTAVVMSYGIFSLLLSLMNVRRAWQNIGYVLIFVIFTVVIIYFRNYINSGLNGFLNDFYVFISEYWDMDFEKTYTEAFAQQHEATITAFFISVGFVLMVLLNFVFNNEQSPLTVLLVVFPVLQFGMYFDAAPSVILTAALVYVLLACFFLRHNHQFAMPTKKKNTRRIHMSHNNYYLHFSNGRVIAQVGAVFAVFMTAVCIVMAVIFPASAHRPDSRLLEVKESTNQTVRQVLLYGFYGLFHKDSDGGVSGLNSGKLGRYGTVYSDYETDLYVTFAPYSRETVYLKSYVGVAYYGSGWANSFPDDEVIYSSPELASAQDLINLEANRLEKLAESDPKILKGRMLVDPQDAALGINYLAYPYYTQFDFASGAYSTSFGGTGYSISELTRVPYAVRAGAYRDLTYYVYPDIWNSSYVDQAPQDEIDRFVRNNYLSVWGANKSSTEVISDTRYEQDRLNVESYLRHFCAEKGFSGSTVEIIEQIRDLFQAEYPYTLNPGVTPKGNDFVTYFLSTQKKGYCSYFATAGTLLLRTMGIPARYVEGYVVSMSDVVDAEFVEGEEYEDWIVGEAPAGKTAVVKADIDDSRAHAWVEVYLNGFGWVPVELTPSSFGNAEDEEFDSLWSRIGRMDMSDDTADFIQNIMDSPAGQGVMLAIRILIGAGIAVALFFAGRSVKKAYERHLGRESFYEGYGMRIMKTYSGLCAWARRKKLIDDDNATVTELVKTFTKRGAGETQLTEFADIYKKAAYSPAPVTKEDRNRFMSLAASIKRSVRCD